MKRPDYYYKGGITTYKEEVDPEVTCWHCGRTFLCDAMDATCRLCNVPFDKSRCEEFGINVRLMTKSPKDELAEIIKNANREYWLLTYQQRTRISREEFIAVAILDAEYIHRSQAVGVGEEKIIEILGKEYSRNERLGMPPESYTSIKYRQAKALATSNIIKLKEVDDD